MLFIHEQAQRRPGGGQGGPDEGQQCLPVALDAEAVEREVVGPLHMGIVAQREIAAVHVDAAQRVAVPFGAAEAVPQKLLLVRRPQLLPGDGRRLGEGRAEPFHHLEAPAGVHQHTGRPLDLTLGGQWRLLGQPRDTVAGREKPANWRTGHHAALPRYFVQAMPSSEMVGRPVVFRALPVWSKMSEMVKRNTTRRRSIFGLAATKSFSGMETLHQVLVVQ